MLVPGDLCSCVGLGGQAGRLGGCRRRVQAGTGWLSRPACRVTLCTPQTQPAHAPSARAGGSPFTFSFLQASEGKPLPLLCQPLLSHLSGPLGPPSCTPSPAVPWALPAAACTPRSQGWAGSALICHAPETGNLSAPTKRQDFPSIAACAGLAGPSLGHVHPMGLSAQGKAALAPRRGAGGALLHPVPAFPLSPASPSSGASHAYFMEHGPLCRWGPWGQEQKGATCASIS